MENIKSYVSIKKENEDLESILDEMYSHESSIKKLYDIGFNDEIIKANAIKLYDFVLCDFHCSKCKGINKCSKEPSFISTKINIINGEIIEDVEHCKQLTKHLLLKEIFNIHDFPGEWLNNSIKNIDKTGPRLKAFTIFNDYLKNNIFNWIYLYGGHNNGKSYFAATLAVEYAKAKKKSVAYLDAEIRFNEYNFLYHTNKKEFDDVLYRYATCDLLVIDNFGLENKSDVIRDQFLLNLLKSRDADKLLTIFVSTYKISDIIDMYNKSRFAQDKAIKIGKLIAKNTHGEINLGSLPIYQ